MLEIRNLTRQYGDTTVVDDISFEVLPGRMTGFVGGNGAGKTTTMRMIMGVLAPNGGEVLWNGAPITVEQRRDFGYMPEERGLYPRMNLVDQLVFLARLHGMTPSDAKDRARELLTHFDLDERRNDLLDSLSLGNQQRVQIAAALIHRPTALILDEPFSGLDPLAVDSMVELLSAETGPDVPVLFSSHQLELVERLCDDLVVLAKGRVVASGSSAELRARGPEQFRVVLTREAALADAGVHVVRRDGEVAFIEAPGRDVGEVARDLAARGAVSEFSRHVEPLSTIFREVTR